VLDFYVETFVTHLIFRVVLSLYSRSLDSYVYRVPICRHSETRLSLRTGSESLMFWRPWNAAETALLLLFVVRMLLLISSHVFVQMKTTSWPLLPLFHMAVLEQAVLEALLHRWSQLCQPWAARSMLWWPSTSRMFCWIYDFKSEKLFSLSLDPVPDAFAFQNGLVCL